MAENFKTLFQVAPLVGVLTDAYTVPGNTQVAVSSMWICNRSKGVTSFRIAVALGGEADDPKQYIAYDVPLLPNQSLPITSGPLAQAGDVFRVWSEHGTISFGFFGVETDIGGV